MGRKRRCPHSLDTRVRDCRECLSGVQKRYRARNHKQWVFLRRLWRYGVDEEWYNKKLEEQNYRCGIPTCGRTEPGGRGGWHVDHKHVEGYVTMPVEERRKYVRGLLCSGCNGQLIKWLESSKYQGGLEYLAKYE